MYIRNWIWLADINIHVLQTCHTFVSVMVLAAASFDVHRCPFDNQMLKGNIVTMTDMTGLLGWKIVIEYQTENDM